MSLYIPKMSDTPAITIPGLASNFNALANSRIAEYGENENGEYWRWENGLQVCRGRHSRGTYDINIPYGTLYETELSTLIYPAPFVATPSISIATSSGSGMFWCRARSSATALYYSVLSANAVTNRNEQFAYLAVGRWK